MTWVMGSDVRLLGNYIQVIKVNSPMRKTGGTPAPRTQLMTIDALCILHK